MSRHSIPLALGLFYGATFLVGAYAGTTAAFWWIAGALAALLLSIVVNADTGRSRP